MPVALDPPTVLANGSLTTNAWTDLDCTSALGDDAGNVAAVILEVESQGNYNQDAETQFRKNGSTDSWLDKACQDNRRTIHYVGVDSDDIFEYYVEDSDSVFRLSGYLTNDEAEFLTNRSDQSLGGINSFTDIDVSSLFTGTAKAVCGYLISTAFWGAGAYRMRNNGSTDSRQSGNASTAIMGFAIPCDGSEIFEMYITSTKVDCYVLGAITDNINTKVNAVDIQTNTINSWVDTDVTSDITEGDDSIMFEMDITNTTNWGFRKNGSTYDNYGGQPEWAHHHGVFVGLDEDDIFEQKISINQTDFFMWASMSTPSSAEVSSKSAGSFCPIAWEPISWVELASGLIVGKGLLESNLLSRVRLVR